MPEMSSNAANYWELDTLVQIPSELEGEHSGQNWVTGNHQQVSSADPTVGLEVQVQLQTIWPINLAVQPSLA